MKTNSTLSGSVIRWFCLWVAGMAVVSLTGCATPGSTYHATATSTNEAAKVSGTLKPFITLRKAALQAVDGVRVDFWQAQSTRPILIDPGQRALFVRGQYVRFFTHGDSYVDLKATLQAGHAYQIKVVLKKREMTFWVEDLATHEEVSDRKTAKVSWIINVGSFGPI